MNRTLVRTAHNPLLYEVQDFGLGIVGADCRLWAEAPGIAGFISALSDTVRSGVSIHGPTGFAEGDVLIVNDPFMTGTHISDTSVYTPIFSGGSLVAFAVVTAHWADIGGKSPGGWAPDTTDVYQEGICFTHQRLVRGGIDNDDLFDLIEANVRVPELVRGDLAAQMAACRRGIERVQRLCERYGPGGVTDAMDQDRPDRCRHASADRRPRRRHLRGKHRARPRRHRPGRAPEDLGADPHRRRPPPRDVRGHEPHRARTDQRPGRSMRRPLRDQGVVRARRGGQRRPRDGRRVRDASTLAGEPGTAGAGGFLRIRRSGAHRVGDPRAGRCVARAGPGGRL